MQFQELIKKTQSAIVQIILSDAQGEYLSSGTGFVSENFFVSNNHVFFDDKNNLLPDNSTVTLRFKDSGNEDLKFEYKNFMLEVKSGSDRDNKDYIIFSKNIFNSKKMGSLILSKDKNINKVGQEIVFLGFPFGRKFLTAHHGYISALYEEGDKRKIQVDASVNPGNSGGPLIDLNSGAVIGIMTRSITGLTQDFDKLINNFNNNLQIFDAVRQNGVLLLNGIDPIEALSISQKQMRSVALNLRRTANVGIGIGYSIEPVTEELNFLNN
jgi:V8-like Glu-specific endopeptidase